MLEAGCRFCDAPRFHPAVEWADRLRLNCGVVRAGDHLVPEGTWRPPTEAELALLLAPGEAGDGAWEQHVCVFAVPEHLRSSWWDRVAAAGDGPPDLAPFARAFSDFAQFKKMPLPARCSFDLVVTPPGRPAATGPFVAGVNLGDERTSLILLNRPPTLRFFVDFPRYPLVRLDLGPGEGVRLPPDGVVLERCPSDKDVDVWLAIRAE
jgi:hypothetical protein